MSTTRGSLHVTEPSLEEINDALRRIRTELDELQGLRGTTSFYAAKTMQNSPFRIVDSAGTLIHALGAKTT